MPTIRVDKRTCLPRKAGIGGCRPTSASPAQANDQRRTEYRLTAKRLGKLVAAAAVDLGAWAGPCDTLSQAGLATLGTLTEAVAVEAGAVTLSRARTRRGGAQARARSSMRPGDIR